VRYEVTREGHVGPTETTATYDYALIRAAEYARKQSGWLRWFVIRRDRAESVMLAIFKQGKRFDARLCKGCKGESAKQGGSWCGACTCLGYVESERA